MNFSDLRKQFPQIGRKDSSGQAIVYLDSAATTLKHRQVIESITECYSSQMSNVHRGAHFVSDQATDRFESVRAKTAQFIGAEKESEIVFTKGTTESLNLLADTLCRTLTPGDQILLSEMEHHSNIVPWQIAAHRYGLKLQFLPVTPSGTLDLSNLDELLSDRCRIVSLVHISNALGTLNPVLEVFRRAKEKNVTTVLDAAQSITCVDINVQTMGCDFLTFSAHKAFGATGLGILYGKEHLLNSLPPYQSGGSMIEKVSKAGSTFLNSPHRFEAGTPHIAGVLSFGETLDLLSKMNMVEVYDHARSLRQMLVDGLNDLEGFQVFGDESTAATVCSFIHKDIHASDIGHLLNQQGLALRTGHHCCQPLMEALNISGTVRASFSVYTNEEDINQLLLGLRKVKEFF